MTASGVPASSRVPIGAMCTEADRQIERLADPAATAAELDNRVADRARITRRDHTRRHARVV